MTPMEKARNWLCFQVVMIFPPLSVPKWVYEYAGKYANETQDPRVDEVRP